MYNSKLLLKKTLIILILENDLVFLNNLHNPPAFTFFFFNQQKNIFYIAGNLKVSQWLQKILVICISEMKIKQLIENNTKCFLVLNK